MSVVPVHRVLGPERSDEVEEAETAREGQASATASALHGYGIITIEGGDMAPRVESFDDEGTNRRKSVR